jgi:hypothetical protein
MTLKKVYYVPGLISLIGLPVLLFLFGPEDKVEQHVLRLHLPIEKLTASDSEFTKGNVLKSMKGRKVINITFWDKTNTGNQRLDDYVNNKKMLFIQNEMEQLQFTHDTTRFLKVDLNEENTYGEFVWLINQATILHYKRYAFFDNSFYFFPNEPPVDYSKVSIEPVIWDKPIIYEPLSKWEILRYRLKYQLEYAVLMVKNSLSFSIGFLVLIMIPSFYYLAKRKNKFAY